MLEELNKNEGAEKKPYIPSKEVQESQEEAMEEEIIDEIVDADEDELPF
jgi:hypothetical protein